MINIFFIGENLTLYIYMICSVVNKGNERKKLQFSNLYFDFTRNQAGKYSILYESIIFIFGQLNDQCIEHCLYR